MHTHRLAPWGAAATVFIGAFSFQAQGVPIRKVAMTDDAAPGLPAGTVFNAGYGKGFTPPSINNSGHVAFMGVVAGGGQPFQAPGIWSEGSGALSLVAYKGWTAPGTSPGVTYDRVASAILNDVGQVSYSAQLTGSGVTSENRTALYAQTDAGIRLVARAGSPAPGAGSGTTFAAPLGSMSFNNKGQTAFPGYLGGAQPGSGLFSEGSGTLNTVARSGVQAPGLPVGYSFVEFQSIVMINNNGAVVFQQQASAPGDPPGTRLSGIWSDRAGTTSLIVSAGQAAPGTESGVTFGSFYYPRHTINDSGAIAFFAPLSGPGISSSNCNGIWLDDSNSLQMLVRMGMSAPNTGSVFASLTTPVLGGGGHILFGSELSGFGLTGQSLWLADPQSQLSMIARVGMDAPGTPAGVQFTTFYTGDNLVSSINALGQVAFYARVGGPGVTSSNNDGIWALDRDGQLQLVIREGDQIEVAPGVFKTVSADAFGLGPFFSGGQDGLTRWFNDRGEVAFRCWLADNSQGLFVATVPEPATGALFATSLLLTICRPRCRNSGLGKSLRSDERLHL